MKYFLILFILLGFTATLFIIPHAFAEQSDPPPVPEPKDDKNSHVDGELFCGLGTTYQDGICIVDKTDEKSVESSSNKWGDVYSLTVFEAPLKQFKSGIAIDEIQCRNSMAVILKYDGSPACVKEQSILKLIERGWAKQLDFINNIADKEDESILNTNTKLVANTADNFIDANNQFALNFYSNVAEGKENNNIFFSPISISTAFAIAYEGAREDTARQIQAIFGFVEDDNERRTEFESILNGFKNSGLLGFGDANYKLQMANALWIADHFEPLQEYIDTAKTYYDSRVDKVDFVTDAGINTINDWVKSETQNKIEKLFKSGSTDENTALIITNVIYFKGEWVKPFHSGFTHERDFYINKNESVKVQMMEIDKPMLNYAQNDLLQIIQLPYKGDRVSMLVLLPSETDGLESLEENLNLENLSQWKNSLEENMVSVYMPKFTAETEYDLKEHLQQMGMQSPFDKFDADFGGISDRQLYISDAIHKAFVSIDEKGTEAAAATGATARLLSGPPNTFRADHPFIFLIQDNVTGQILFMGKVVDPSQ